MNLRRTLSTAPATPRSSELRMHLEKVLSIHLGRHRSIVGLSRRLCPYTSSFRIEELDVRLDDGTDLRLVLKDLGEEGMLDEARRARPRFLYQPTREIQTYRWILSHGPAGTPVWYGAVTQPRIGRYWLFLERVDGLELRHVGAFSAWEQAASWIGRFHGSFSPARVQALARSSQFLIYDAEFYACWLDRAQRFCRRNAAGRAGVGRVARKYAAVVERLVALPQTLIHGEFYPCNVLIRTDHHRVRVCPVDWEMAGLASGLMDLASLTAGWSSRCQGALARAYLRGIHGETGRDRPPPIPRTFWFDLDCCRLHLAMKMLGWSDEWMPPPQHAYNWLSETVRIANRLKL